MRGSINQLRTVSNSGEIKSSHTMGISDTWSQQLWVVTVQITCKIKDRLRVDRLNAPYSFTKTIKHSVIRTWASIDNKQITIQPWTGILATMNSQQEHSNLSCRKTERPEPTNNAIPSPFGRAPQQQSCSFETRQKQVRHMPTTSYLSLGTGYNIKFSCSNG